MKDEKRREDELTAQTIEEPTAGEAAVQTIDDRNISDIVGGRNPFNYLPHIPNASVDEDVTENG